MHASPRKGPLSAFLVLTLVALPARAHDSAALNHLRPGMAFSLYAMKAVLPGPTGPARGVVDFTPLRGSALAFLVIDPFLPRDLAEARRFEKLARRLPNTRAFLVALPERSLQPQKLVEAAAKEKLGLPLLIDERDVFPFAFGFPLTVSPRYELFDRSGTLILQNAARLSQRLPTGLTVAMALAQLDRGNAVEPAALTTRDDLGR